MRFPVEDKIDDIKAALAKGRDVVLCAPPGSGKTTCVPPALLGEPWLSGKKIVMLEPRRIAARSCASYISHRLGEDVGGTVGYRVRLENKTGPSTRLEIVTEGLLAQRLVSDPELKGVGLVIFDEFHERSLACDLAFALALESKNVFRGDLRILVMSATLDAEEVASRLPDPETIEAKGRMFPVETRYLGDISVSAAVFKAAKETSGDILAFLPGEAEIRRTETALEELGNRFDIFPLFGSLPKEEQDRVFLQNQGKRRIVLATSIAETSLTIPGITCVVDCGLMRIPRFSPSTGMSSLATVPLSRDRAEQRRGRAGRISPGICYRLWNEGADRLRPAKMTPEVMDADLAPVVLACAAWGAPGREDLPWMTPPPAAAWERAVKLLTDLDAIDSRSVLTAKGERMAKIAAHPRLSSMLLGTGDSKSLERAALLAAIMEEGSRSRETDISKIADEVLETQSRPFSRRILQLARRFSSIPRFDRHGIDPGGFRFAVPPSDGALLALAYPDRLAKNRGNGSFRMAGGRGAAVDGLDPLAKCPWIVCCELDDRQGDAHIFRACEIGENEVERLFAGKITSGTRCEWDRREERVKSVRVRTLGGILLDEKPDLNADPEEMRECMAAGIRQKGVENLPCWSDASKSLKSRMDFVSRHCGWPEIGDGEIVCALLDFAAGVTRWRDLDKIDMIQVLRHAAATAGCDMRNLDLLAPQRMELPNGRSAKIDYEGAEPVAEARLQDCFGMTSTPKVGGGKIPVVMTLLSPARRPIQITKDLAGFWRENYALVRKDMRGRYPKHDWPENPCGSAT